MIITIPETDREWTLFHRNFYNDTHLVPDVEFYKKWEKNWRLVRKRVVFEAIKNNKSKR
jgi:hypothetical protein